MQMLNTRLGYKKISDTGRKIGLTKNMPEFIVSGIA